MNKFLEDITDIKDIYLTEFELFKSKEENADSPFIHNIRKEAIKAFAELTFPTQRNEDWKYTNISPLLKHSFRNSSTEPKDSLSGKSIDSHVVIDKGSILLSFVNGIYREELSDTKNLPANVIVGNITNFHDHPILKEHFAKYVSYNKDIFNAWNTAFTKDGAFIYIPDGITVAVPVYLVYLNNSEESNFLSCPRTLAFIGKNSRITLIEHYGSLSNSNYNFTNAVGEIILEENAVADYYKIQNESKNTYHISTVQVNQNQNSSFVSHTITYGGEIVRNNLNVVLNGKGCETTMKGLYVLADKQHVDNHTFIDHAQPFCNSNELYKGVMDDQSHGVFSGKIMVRKDAQKTNAFQSSKNILLSDKALADTKPQLEIFANDVKCSHGATTGQLNDEALFYLRSRGISEAKAKVLLIHAFANDILETVKVKSLKENLNFLLSEQFDIS